MKDLAFEIGPEGFERRFDANVPDLPAIFERFEAAIERMVRQTAGLEPVPWASALETIARAFEPNGIDWWLVGSAALAARGVDVAPRDLDIVVAESDVLAATELLSDVAIEPLSINDGWVARYFCRGFSGARIEWIAGVRERTTAPEPSDFGPFAEARRERVEWRGFELKVPPLALQLAVTERRGLIERAAAIAGFVDAHG